MKYNRSQEEKLDLKLFENPEKEYNYVAVDIRIKENI